MGIGILDAGEADVSDDLFTLYRELRVGVLIRPLWRLSGVGYWKFLAVNSTS